MRTRFQAMARMPSWRTALLLATVASGHADAAGPRDPTDTASSRARLADGIASVQRRLDVPPEELERWGMPPRAVDHVVLHQILAFGPSVARVRHLARSASFDDDGTPSFATGWGHRNAAAAVLATTGNVSMDEPLASGSGRHFTLRAVASGIRNGADECRLTDACSGGSSDPSWTIRFLTQAGVSPNERIAGTGPDELTFDELVSRTWLRLRASDTDFVAAETDFVENGLHALDALGFFARRHPTALVPAVDRASGRSGTTIAIGTLVSKGDHEESWRLGAELLGWLDPKTYLAQDEASLDTVVEALAVKLTRTTGDEQTRAGRRLVVVLVGIGHALEALADPDGGFLSQLDARDRARTLRSADRLARLVLRVSTGELHARAMSLPDLVVRTAWLSSVLHAAHALALVRDHIRPD